MILIKIMRWVWDENRNLTVFNYVNSYKPKEAFVVHKLLINLSQRICRGDKGNNGITRASREREGVVGVSK